MKKKNIGTFDITINRLAAIATIIGLIVSLLAIFISPKDNKESKISQKVIIEGNHNNVEQKYYQGIEKSKICQDGEMHYKDIIDDLEKRMNNSFDKQKKQLSIELKLYKQKLLKYKINCKNEKLN